MRKFKRLKPKGVFVPLNKIWLTVKLVTLFLFLNLLQLSACMYPQKNSLSLKNKYFTLKEVFEETEQQATCRFVFRDNFPDENKTGYLFGKQKNVEELLKDLLVDTSLKYLIFDNYLVVITSKEGNERKQEFTIKGIVTDYQGKPLSGVNIIEKGTANGTVTNFDGEYSISLTSPDAILVFSFIGFLTKEIEVKNQTTVNLSLIEDIKSLDEVVMIAYGTTKKKDLTGSISTVANKHIAIQANSTITRALEGAVPGIQVASVDGQPGLDMGIRLRGLASSKQNYSNALVVIDGVPAQHDNPLSTINPKDIENVTILKDAASTALYGSRGANGVVLITTKKGEEGKTQISFEGRWGVNQVGPYQYDKISNPKDIYEYAWLAIYNSVRYGVDGSGVSKNYTTNVQSPNMSHDEAAAFASAHLFDYTGSTTSFSRNALGNWMLYDVPGVVYTPSGTGSSASSTMSGAYLVNTDGKLNPDAKLLYNENYDKYLLENNFRQEYNLSARGGSDKINYFVSLGYLEDPSYIPGSWFKRYNGRSNINTKLYGWLKVGTNISYSWRETQSPATRWGRNPGSAQANIFRYINGQNQLIQLYARDEEGNYFYEDGEKKVHVEAGDTYSPLGLTSTSLASTNPLYMLDHDKDIRKSGDVITRSYAEIRLMEGLTFTTNFGLEKYHETRTRYWNSYTGQAEGTGALGKIYQNVTVLNTQQLLNYSHDFDRHHADALLGHEFNHYHLELLNYKSAYELIPGFATFVNFVGRYVGGTFSGPGGTETENAMESYFGRVNYIYDNKYYAEASFRKDGTSKFKTNSKRWGNFWSVGAGWRISSEDFMALVKGWLDNLKIRASYGLLGNQSGIGNYATYQLWSYSAIYSESTSGTGIPASYKLSKSNFVNDGLTWEKTRTFDAGIDFTLYNFIHGTFDVYDKYTINAIWDQPIASSLGQSTLLTNTAKIRNRGYEVELAMDIIKNSDLFWSVSLNGTHYTISLAGVPDGVGSDELDGCWTATADRWTVTGGGAHSGVTYLGGVNKDYYNIYLFKYAGVDQGTGLPLFYHRVTSDDHLAGLYSGTEIGSSITTTDYSQASRYEMGSAVPDWIGGFSTTVRYRNFDFTGVLAYQFNGKFYSTEYGNNLYRSDRLSSALSDELIGNTWTPGNTDAEFPMVMYGNTYGDGSTFGSWLYTDMALFNASYLNLKNLTLGYTLPENLLKKYKIDGLRVYVSADNLLMVTSHSGIDPRMSLIGGFEVGAYTYPSMRTISLGVNLDL